MDDIIFEEIKGKNNREKFPFQQVHLQSDFLVGKIYKELLEDFWPEQLKMVMWIEGIFSEDPNQGLDSRVRVIRSSSSWEVSFLPNSPTPE